LSGRLFLFLSVGVFVFCVGANLYQAGICRVNFDFGVLLTFMVIEIRFQIVCCI